MNLVSLYRKDLERIGDYPIQCSKDWFAIFPDKIEKRMAVAKKNGRTDLNIIIYREDPADVRSYHSIPLSSLSALLDKKHLTHSKVNGSIRWNCTRNNHIISTSHCDIKFDAREYFQLPLSVEPRVLKLSEEVAEAENYVEGRVVQVAVNRYERDPDAREICIREKGSSCLICGFDFGVCYGGTMAGFIHVHHLNPLHLSMGERKINPRTDLIPVCPNCHAVIHSKKTPLTVDEVKLLINENKGIHVNL